MKRPLKMSYAMLKENEVADLHCDLLAYLARNPSHTPSDSAVPCGIPYLDQGKVGLQVLAIFTETGSQSVASGAAQFEWYQKLNGPRFLLAIENASSFCSEGESFDEGLKRLNEMDTPLYISLTWNGENRFGGGVGSDAGLKEDGKRLLEVMAERGIAVDLSHTTDRLAEEILATDLPLKVLASHSNFRSVCNVERNLPDHLAKEVAHRQGVIGLNFVAPFVGGTSIQELCHHVEHAQSLGVIDHLAFGADFFAFEDIPEDRRRDDPYFFEDAPNSSCYPVVLRELSKTLSDSERTSVQYGAVAKFLGD